MLLQSLIFGSCPDVPLHPTVQLPWALHVIALAGSGTSEQKCLPHKKVGIDSFSHELHVLLQLGHCTDLMMI